MISDAMYLLSYKWSTPVQMWFHVIANIFIFTYHWTLSPALNEHQQFNVILIKSSLCRATCFTVKHETKMTISCPQGRDSLRRWWRSSQHVTSKFPQSCLKVVISCLKVFQNCTKNVPNVSQIVWKLPSRSSQSFLESISKLSHSYLKVVSCCSKVVPKLSQSCIKVSSKLSQGCVTVVSELSQSYLKNVPKFVSKWAKNCFKIEWRVEGGGLIESDVLMKWLQ